MEDIDYTNNQTYKGGRAMEREIMTVKEVSLYLGVHPDTIYDMASKKEVPCFKMRSKILFSKKSIDSWIKDQEKKQNK